MPRMSSSAKVNPEEGKERQENKERKEQKEELPAQPQEENISWEELPGPVLEMLFNHLKAAALVGQPVFLKSPDQQRRVTAVGVRLGSVCRAWQAEARFIFFRNWWETPNSITHPRQCFSLAPKPQPLFQCSFVAEVDNPSMHGRYSLYEGTETGKLLMTAEFRPKESSTVLYQQGKKWEECGGVCAKSKGNLLNTHYVVESSAFGSGKRSCLGDIRYVDRIKACMSPRKMKVTLPGREALKQYDPCSPISEPPMEDGEPGGKATEVAAMTADASRLSKFGFGLSMNRPLSENGLTGQPRSQEWILVNREPEYRAELRGWCLNFKGRVRDPSVKNFQLVDQANPSELVMQFGRMKGDSYILDFQPHVISAAQAFAVALSNFHR